MAPSTCYERKAELKAFDDTKIGVKGLVDGGVSKLPHIFVNDQPPSPRATNGGPQPERHIPLIDLAGLEEGGPERRREIIKNVSDAVEEWGFFQVVNHGIPQSVLDEMIEGARRFHELDPEAKKPYYDRTANTTKKFCYLSNFFLYTGPVANWRDTTVAMMEPTPAAEEFPECFRDITMEFGKSAKKLGHTFMELLSEGMGLNPTHLKEMDCAEDVVLLTHYYPPCPQPELAVGINKHADSNVLTILHQDEIGGLQVLHDDLWYDVPHIPGAFVVNTGDFLQLLSNGKYNSVIHRVQSKKVGPRISVGLFFRPRGGNPRLLGPIKEILSEKNPPIYKATTTGQYLAHYTSIGQDHGVEPSLKHLRLNN